MDIYINKVYENETIIFRVLPTAYCYVAKQVEEFIKALQCKKRSSLLALMAEGLWSWRGELHGSENCECYTGGGTVGLCRSVSPAVLLTVQSALVPLPTKSSLHEQALQFPIYCLLSLYTLCTIHNSLYCLNHCSIFCSSPASRVSVALSVQAYSPRALKPIKFLTSLRQMFTTKID